MRILSTKILSRSQQELLLNSGLGFVHYDAISIEQLDISSVFPKELQNVILTSLNGAIGFCNEWGKKQTNSIGVHGEINFFAVGYRTEAFLLEKGQKTTKTAQNAAQLAQYIAKNHKKESFHYFCGDQRRDELPELLKSNKIELFEVETYKNTPNLRHFDQKWDGILFFSPSGVESFLEHNELGDAYCFCIGPTTANALAIHTSKVVMAHSTSVESVIAKAVKTLMHVST